MKNRKNSPTQAQVCANWGCLPKSVVFGGNVIYLESSLRANLLAWQSSHTPHSVIAKHEVLRQSERLGYVKSAYIYGYNIIYAACNFARRIYFAFLLGAAKTRV